MNFSEIQYVADQQGHPTGVLIPITTWREIQAKLAANDVNIHLPPLKKGGRGGFRRGSRVQIPPNPPLLKGGTERLPNDLSQQTTAWDVLDELTGSITAPPDWAEEHDHYFYGTPKRQMVDQLL